MHNVRMEMQKMRKMLRNSPIPTGRIRQSKTYRRAIRKTNHSRTRGIHSKTRTKNTQLPILQQKEKDMRDIRTKTRSVPSVRRWATSMPCMSFQPKI